METILPSHIVKFIESQIDLHSKKSSKGHRYSTDMKAFAITLYHLSGKAYKMISKLFCLPSKSALLRWVSRLPNSPGLPKSALDVLATKVKTMSHKGRLCLISFDEMSLKSNVFYQSNTDELIGLEDFGDGIKTNCVASSAIVFMARGVVDNWKQPLAYYLVNESCSSTKVREKLEELIDKVESIGLEVVGLVSDIGSNFQKFVREMGITPEKPWFVYKGKQIYYLFDPPHIIKAVRNNLMKYDYHFENKVASWRDITALYELDSNNSIRCCPKLTNTHISPNGFQKMKVKLATQVLSHTVSAAMLMAVSGGLLPASAAGTAELVANFDKIFDSLNSTSFKSHKPHNRPITAESDHCQFMNEMHTFIKGVTVKDPTTGKDMTSQLKCLKALQMTLNGTILLWNSLKSSITFLCTRRLNQDPLENFFGCIRQQGGNCDTPTPVQFIRAFRKLFFDNFLSPSNGNCSADIDKMLAGHTALDLGNKNNFSHLDQSIPKGLNIVESDYQLESVDDLMCNNAITYVAGYLLKKCFQQHKCNACWRALTNNELDSPNQIFCHFKAYNDKKGPFGSLIVPSTSFVQYITNIEQELIVTFSNSMTMSGVGKHIVDILPEFTGSNCAGFPSNYLLRLFVRMRIYYVVKYKNRELAQKKGDKKNRKYFKIAHL